MVCKNWNKQLELQYFWLEYLLKEKKLGNKKTLEELKNNLRMSYKEMTKKLLNFHKETINSLKTVKKTEENKLLIKSIIVGESGVGKTSIMKRFVYGDFQKNCGSTIGFDFCNKDVLVDQFDVKLQIWDLPGNTVIYFSFIFLLFKLILFLY